MAKTLQELRQEPHLSISALNTYIGCGLRYRFRYIDKAEPEHQSPNLVLGSAIHKVMEIYYLAKQEERHVEDKELLDCLENSVRGACRNDRPAIRFGKREDLKSLVEQGKRLIRCFQDQAPEESSRVLAVEQPFRLEVPGLDVPILSVVDLILEDDDGTISIVDHKTAGRAMSDKDIHGSDQLTLYQMALKAAGYEGREIILRFDTLIKTKTSKFEQYFTSRTDADEQRLVRKFQEAWRGIQAGVFIPNDSSWLCTSCEFQTTCKKEWATEKAA